MTFTEPTPFELTDSDAMLTAFKAVQPYGFWGGITADPDLAWTLQLNYDDDDGTPRTIMAEVGTVLYMLEIASGKAIVWRGLTYG